MPAHPAFCNTVCFGSFIVFIFWHYLGINLLTAPNRFWLLVNHVSCHIHGT